MRSRLSVGQICFHNTFIFIKYRECVQFLIKCADVLFPRKCFGCGSLGGYVCAKCAQSMVLKKGVRIETMPCGEIDIGIAFVPYQGLFKTIITNAKYGNYQQIFKDLCEKLITNSVAFQLRHLLKDTKNIGIFPVPMHPKKKRLRGFNQAECMAVYLADKLDYPVYGRSIEKINDTVPQASLNCEQRHINIKNAFRVSPNVSNLPKTALIVDDVWTTGSTVQEVARVLKTQGVQHVVVCTLARRWYNTST